MPTPTQKKNVSKSFQHRLAGEVVPPVLVTMKTKGQQMIPCVDQKCFQRTYQPTIGMEDRDLDGAIKEIFRMQRKIYENGRRHKAGYAQKDAYQ